MGFLKLCKPVVQKDAGKIVFPRLSMQMTRSVLCWLEHPRVKKAALVQRRIRLFAWPVGPERPARPERFSGIDRGSRAGA